MRVRAVFGLVVLMAALGCALMACSVVVHAGGGNDGGSGFTVNDYVGLPSAVSCSSADSCLAVGTVGTDGGASGGRPTADAWNGTSWRPIAVRLPAGTSGGLTGVSCRAGSCLAIGDFVGNAGGGSVSFAVAWNGRTLRAIPAPPPYGYEDQSIDTVSCLTATDCITLVTSMATGRAAVDTWNGSRWASRPAADPGGVAAGITTISCVSAVFCVLGGTAATVPGSEKPLLALWNGRTIRPLTVPAPAATDVSTDEDPPVIYRVSCLSTMSCVAVGTYNTDSASTTGFGFAEVLSGTTWREATLRAPAGASRSMLFGLSCATPASCLAVGTVVSASGVASAAAVSYDGARWTWLTDVPGPRGGDADYFGDVFCPAVGGCVAAGQVGRAPSSFASPLLGAWAGRSWRLSAVG